MLKIIVVLVVLFSTVTVLSFSSYSRINRVVSPSAVTSSIPAPLSNMKAQTEDIIENVSKKNWEKVIQDLRMITSDWSTFQPQAVKDGIAPAILDSLSLTVVNLHKTCTSQDVLATMQAANDISSAIVDLFYFYHSVIPIDVEYLTIFEHQLLVDVMVKNWNATEQTLTLLNEVWRRVEPFVIEHAGYFQAIEFTDCMENQNAAFQTRDTMTISLEARHGLGIVDELENHLKIKV